jgi:nitronate monooxygenase
MIFYESVLAQKLGIRFPIIQAPMAGGATTPQLIAAVSNSGGLGSLGAGYMEPNDIRITIKKIRELTNKPFAVNLFIPENYTINPASLNLMQQILLDIGSEIGITDDTDYEAPYAPNFDEQLKIIIEEQVPIFSFTFGIPAKEQIEILKQNNIILIGTATNVSEGLALERDGIDMIVAQGSEAGGHRGTFLPNNSNNLIGLMSLIPQIVAKVTIPVIATGSIMSRAGVDAVLQLGADGACLGTAFLTTHESGINSKYKEVLLNTKFDDTILTKAFSGKMARGVKNYFIEQMENHIAEILPYPVQNKLTQNLRKKASSTNNINFMSMWAGQGACLCKSISTFDLMQELCL